MNGQRGHDWRVSLGIWTHHSLELFEFPSTSPAIIRWLLEAAQIWKKFTGNWFWKLVSSSVSGVVCVLAGIVFWFVMPKQHVFPDNTFICAGFYTLQPFATYTKYVWTKNPWSLNPEQVVSSIFPSWNQHDTTDDILFNVKICVSLFNHCCSIAIVGSWLRILGYETPIECVAWRVDFLFWWPKVGGLIYPLLGEWSSTTSKWVDIPMVRNPSMGRMKITIP